MQRLRYFLLAKRKPIAFAWSRPTSYPPPDLITFIPFSKYFSDFEKHPVAPLSNFLDPADGDMEAYRVPAALVQKKGILFGNARMTLSAKRTTTHQQGQILWHVRTRGRAVLQKLIPALSKEQEACYAKEPH